ncbi:MAG: nucleoside kinase [Bacteroidales bacterium]|nr:nucleoside kinase [Bacteroidales bacterium]MBN2756417.1 nucleoside kinase [Bacteroidales bacterium]
MGKIISIKCLNNNKIKDYKLGTSLKDIVEDQDIKLKYPILGAMVNNELEELNYEIYKPKTVKFIDITHKDGLRMYIRSLSFVLIKAVKELYPDKTVKIENSVSKGFYCEIEGIEKDNLVQTTSDVEHKMRQIINQDIPFIRKDIPVEQALEIFKQNNFNEKHLLFSTCPKLYTSVYYLGDLVDYFYGYLVPSTGYLKVFDLISYFDGMLLRIPKSENPEMLEDIVQQNKMFEIFKEFKAWGDIIDVGSIGSINNHVINNNSSELIKISEALHEKKIAQIADNIYHKKDKVKLILISGPSASGKTTFSKRLSVQLKVLGLKPIQLSLDNYFVDRDKTPTDENGEYNFEVLEALDLKLLYQNLNALLKGNKVKMPKFSFETGKSYLTDEYTQITDEHIFVIEGIHALNPKLLDKFDYDLKFKIYVSALTQVGIDHHNRIPTTDNRLLRRIVRDNQYRNYSAKNTIKRWPSIRKGEDLYIFPFQEEADIMFNSALFYELGVLKNPAEAILNQVSQIDEEYSEAMRLLKFLSYFKSIPEKEIPPTSILREFLSGSSFHY